VEEIQEEFADLDIDITDDEVLLKLKEFCDVYNIDANKISCEYFSFNTKSKINVGKTPTIDMLLQFEHDKLKQIKGPRRPLDPIEGVENLPDCAEVGTPTRLLSASNVAKRNLTPDGQVNKRFVTAMGSPSVASPNSQTIEGSQSFCKYSERKNKGEVVLGHNKDAAGDWTPSSVSPTLTLTEGCLDKPYKFMFESMRERAAVLDETICKMADLIMERLEVSEVMDTRLTEVEPHLAVGRILCDSEGHLNSNSVVLQGSMDSCGGHTIPLDLSKLEAYSFFPGQIVGVECTNPNGSRLLVNKLHPEVCAPPAPYTGPDQVLDILVSCGPYTPNDSDNAQPLMDILEVIKETKPHVAFLIGPFVDMKNSSVGDGNENYQAIFDRMLTEVYSAVEELRTDVVLVPSLRDAHENFVYPQPPYHMDATLFNNKIKTISDPSLLSVNGVRIGVTSSDILFHLGREEISFPPRAGDRLSRLASHLLSQHSFYPLYPPNLEQNIDFEHQELHGLLDQSPHLLLLPSDLVYFVRELDSCTILNPGRLTKGPGPGTYSSIKAQAVDGKISFQAEIVRI